MIILNEKEKSIGDSSSIQTLTVGPGISPGRSAGWRIRGLYRRSGITPCPEEFFNKMQHRVCRHKIRIFPPDNLSGHDKYFAGFS